ncbi:polyprenyl synthetase family protein [Sporosarcina sp. CAU 1771]
MHEKLKSFIDTHIPIIDNQLNVLLDEIEGPILLKSSMAYSVNAGGKRIRPLLVLATLKDLGVESKDALLVACAVEFIHTYSLIHDDLPCMDDDDYRRGKLTNHKVYGEAVAVLAGDALQTLAFNVLSRLPNTPPTQILELVRLLSNSSGAQGMVGGQILDIEGEASKPTLSMLEEVHLNKTGALLSFCIEAGAELASLEKDQTDSLKAYAKNIGLAFQIQDDILDITATTEELGKTAGSDEASDKATYPSLLGLEGAKKQLDEYHFISKQSLLFLENEESLLALFADYIVKRSY